MKVRFFNSTEGTAFWKKLLHEIAALGFEVSHPFSVAETNYRGGSQRLQKLLKFWKMFPWYATTTFLRPGKASCYVATTNPFFLPALVRCRVGSRRGTILLLYDLYPDALELSSLVTPNKILSRMIGYATKYAVANCSATVFLGDVLRDHVESRYGKAKQSVVIPVGADGSPFKASIPRSLEVGQAVQIAYCGNLGRAHETTTLKNYFQSAQSAPIKFSFYASGKGYDEFKQSVTSELDSRTTCCFSGPLPNETWVDTMRSTHVALVTIKPGWENVVMPSKTYSAMVAGQAILAICPRNSDLAKLVEKHDCGWIVEPGDVESLGNVLEQQVADPRQLLEKRTNSFKAGHAYYDCSVVAAQWTKLFSELSH